MKDMNKKLTKMNKNIMAIQNGIQDSVANAIAPLTARIDAQGSRLEKVERRQKKFDENIKDSVNVHVQEMIKEHLKTNPSPLDTYASAAASSPVYSKSKMPRKEKISAAEEKSSDNDEWFWAARKKLRFFPIPGQTNEDLLTGLDDFIINKLRIPAGVLNKEDVVYVRKVRSAKKSKVQDELLVSFRTVQTRDLVQSYARNLSTWIGDDGKPTAGIRMEIPERLIGSFKALEEYGHAMRGKHGNGFKRHIKIDDTLLCLYLDICLPKQAEWIRVDMEHVLADNKGRRDKKAKKTDKNLLSTVGSDDEKME